MLNITYPIFNITYSIFKELLKLKLITKKNIIKIADSVRDKKRKLSTYFSSIACFKSKSIPYKI